MHDDDNGDGDDDDDDDLCGDLKSLLAKLHACETSRYLNVHSMGFQCPSFWPDGFLHMLSKKEPLTFSTFPLHCRSSCYYNSKMQNSPMPTPC